MKKISLLLLVAACLGAGGVKAQAPTNQTQVKAKPARCPPATGSRLGKAPDAQGRCDEAPPLSRSYSREDIERTGQLDAGQALQILDPSLNRR